MPSPQATLPPEVANNAIRLYRHCLRQAKFVGRKLNNIPAVIEIVREQFKKNMDETDPEKIQELKGEAVRVLTKYTPVQSQKMSGSEVSQAS